MLHRGLPEALDMQTETIIGLLASVFAVTAGAIFGGLEHPMTYLLGAWVSSSAALYVHRRAGYRWWTWVAVLIVMGFAAYGVVWTVGFHRAGSETAALVYIGISGCIAFTELAAVGNTKIGARMHRIVQVLLASLLSPFISLIAFFSLWTRIDNPNILRALVAADIFLGPLCGLVLGLFIHAKLQGRVRTAAIWIYPVIAALITGLYLDLHFGQVIARGGDPIEMLQSEH